MRRLALVPVLLLALAGPAFAQPFETPEALLEAFYEPYFSNEFPENDPLWTH